MRSHERVPEAYRVGAIINKGELYYRLLKE